LVADGFQFSRVYPVEVPDLEVHAVVVGQLLSVAREEVPVERGEGAGVLAGALGG
jgi:hypothetical protein